MFHHTNTGDIPESGPKSSYWRISMFIPGMSFHSNIRQHDPSSVKSISTLRSQIKAKATEIQ